ncbi:MAG: alpha-(1-_3)-arabinofuranosyltransferase domain-containing protein [Acidimicrobiia bacterium]
MRVGDDRSRRTIGYTVLAALAYVPVLLTAPGRVAADTKQYLYLDPSRLLARAWSMWDPNIGFGTVTHQNIGYLFPMGPFYWTFDRVGVPDWVAQRLWLGSIMFAAALGMLYLFRTLGVRGAGAVVGTLLFMLSPYSLDYAARISVILLPWAGLPWMLGVLIRGLRQGGWWHAAWFAVIVQVIGGVNATALVFAGLAPLVWILHSVFVTREVRFGRAVATTAKIGVLTVASSAWWMSGLWAQGSYGLDILKYTETLRAVSRTSLPNEVLRGLGYWFFYGRDKLGPWIESSATYTQRPLMILISYGIPFLALASAAFVTWRYRSYFVTLVVIGVVIAVGAHPYDTPTPIGALFKHLAATSTAAFALRSTGRATPLVILGLAALVGAGTSAFTDWVGAVRWARVPLRVGVPVVVGALMVVNLPALWNGTFYGKNLQRGEDVPAYWHQATKYLDRQSHDTRVLELPGADFASYRWGNTVDPITPGLMDRPYVARELIPYGSAASANLLNAFDLRVQDRALPSTALSPLAQLMGVGDYVLRNDIQFERYRVLRPQFTEALFTPAPSGLDHAATFGTPDTSFATQYPFQDEQALALGKPLPTPNPVDVFRVQRPAAIVRTIGSGSSILMSGDGDGTVDLGSLGALDAQPLVLDSASLSAAQMRAQAGSAGSLVVTDSNRLRARRWSTVTDTVGYTEGPGNHPIRFDESDARLDMFPDAPADASTTVVLQGVRRVGATSYGNPITYTPEDRPARAFDGDLTTSWRTGAFSDVRGERIEVETLKPLTTDRVNLVQVLQKPNARWITHAVLRFDGKDATDIDLGPESRTPKGQTVRFPAHTFRTLSIEIRDTNLGQLRDYGGIDPVGFTEIRLRDGAGGPPVRAREVTVMPTDLTRAVGKDSASHPLTFSMRRERVIPVPPRHDPELSMIRQISVPTARDFGVGTEVRLSSWASDSVLDELLGYRGPIHASASDRLPGAPADRASAALDHDPATAWVTPFADVVGQHLTVEVPATRTVDHLDLQLVADGLHSVPTRLTITDDQGGRQVVAVPAVQDNATPGATTPVTVSFPALTGRAFTVRVSGIRKVTTHEWYCECDEVMPVGIAELGVPGLDAVRPAAQLPGTCRSDLLRLDGQPVAGRVVGTTAAAVALEPLRFERCNATTRPTAHLDAGTHLVTTARGDQKGWNLDRVVLARSAHDEPRDLGPGATVALSSPAPPTAPRIHVTSQGRASVRAVIDPGSAPFWLVLGQSANPGWQATVDGRDLGASTLVDGYANGWLVHPHGNRPLSVELDWTPQRTVNLALGITIGGLLACAGIVLVAGTRRRRLRAGAPAGAVAATTMSPAFTLPWRTAPVSSPWPTAVPAALAAGVFGAVAVSPPIGLVTVAVVLLAARWRPARIGLRLAPPIALAGCGAFIAAKQIYAKFPPTFEWPTFFSEIRTLGWLVVVFLVADAILGMAESRRRP